MSARIRHKKSVKKTTKKRKANRRVNNAGRKIMLSILTFLFSSAILFGFFFVNSLNKRFAGAESATTVHNSYYTVLYVTLDDFSSDVPMVTKMSYKIMDTDNKKITTIKMAPTDNLFFGEKYGEVAVAKVFSTAKLTNSDDLSKTVGYINIEVNDLFAFPVDRYVYSDSKDSILWEGIFNSGNYLPFLVDTALHRGQSDHITNFTLDEIYKMAQFVAELPKERFVDRQYASLDFSELDDELRELTLESHFAKDAKSISVLNASDKSGLASQAAREIINMGGRVVSIDNANNKFDENFLVSDTPDDLSTTLIARVFGIQKIISKQEASQHISNNDMYRADIVLVMGK
jgi:hypothetical protein